MEEEISPVNLSIQIYTNIAAQRSAPDKRMIVVLAPRSISLSAIPPAYEAPGSISGRQRNICFLQVKLASLQNGYSELLAWRTHSALNICFVVCLWDFADHISPMPAGSLLLKTYCRRPPKVRGQNYRDDYTPERFTAARWDVDAYGAPLHWFSVRCRTSVMRWSPSGAAGLARRMWPKAGRCGCASPLSRLPGTCF